MKLKIREIAIFAMLGAIMFVSKVIMEGLPNIHLLGTLVIAYTITYRAKALFPIYAYVFANGLWEGFRPFDWLPETYIWLILWGMTMLLPKKMPTRVAPIVYMLVSAVHGLLLDVFYVPAYLLFANIPWEHLRLTLLMGIPYVALQAAGNFVLGTLIVPVATLLRKLDKKI
jgi:energy-coupling factor transport system substrate-specific component